MNVRLKKLDQQVVVITGASSGIGLVTARMAAERGARVVVAARNEQALRQLVGDISQGGGEAIDVVADVGREEDVRRIADTAVERFGGFDTWVNNAGVSIYGRLLDVSLEDHRRLFETNFWGVVHGSTVAAEHLLGRGGAIINVGSIVSDRAIPVQGMYSASKHAVKGFTDALRMELEADGAPVSVTLVKPAAINTPFTQNAKNYMPLEPNLPPPVYAPETVAETILHCAQEPVRDVFVGGGGKAISAAGTYAPRLTDRVMASTMFDQQQKDHPDLDPHANGLHGPSRVTKERGNYEGMVFENSLYTKASLHPVITGVVAVSLGFLVAGMMRPPSRH